MISIKYLAKVSPEDYCNNRIFLSSSAMDMFLWEMYIYHVAEIGEEPFDPYTREQSVRAGGYKFRRYTMPFTMARDIILVKESNK